MRRLRLCLLSTAMSPRLRHRACHRAALPNLAVLDQGGALCAPLGRRQRPASALGGPAERAPAPETTGSLPFSSSADLQPA